MTNGEKKDTRLTIRFAPDEYAELAREAARAGRPISQWVRITLLAAAAAITAGCVQTTAKPLDQVTVAISARGAPRDTPADVRQAVLRRAAQATQQAGQPCFMVLSAQVERSAPTYYAAPSMLIATLPGQAMILPGATYATDNPTADAVIRHDPTCRTGSWRAADILGAK